MTKWYEGDRLKADKVKISFVLSQDHPIEHQILNMLPKLPRGETSRFMRGLLAKGFVQLVKEKGLDVGDAIEKYELINYATGGSIPIPKTAMSQPKQPTTPVQSFETTQQINQPAMAQSVEQPTAQTMQPMAQPATQPTAQSTAQTAQPATQPATQGKANSELSPFLQQHSTYRFDSVEQRPKSGIDVNSVEF